MKLEPPERISRIRETATLLDKQEWPDIDLILSQFGLPTSDYAPSTKSAYVVDMIKDAADDALISIHDYLVREAGGEHSSRARGPWTGQKLRLFCSHLAAHKADVASVGDALQRFGIEPFVAHDSIEPSEEWAQVIENALADCDAMLVFLHPGFAESKWCDQEVGWILGRQRPVLPLNYGIDPYGFLGKYQAQRCSHAAPSQVAMFVVDWLTKVPSLHARVAHGLVDAFVNSWSWDFTRQMVPLLERMTSVDDDDLTRMEEAARNNVDVRQCIIPPGRSGPEWVAEYVKQRRGAVEPPRWSDEPPF